MTKPLPARLGVMDRFLPVWIGIAMASGLALGRVLPGQTDGVLRP